MSVFQIFLKVPVSKPAKRKLLAHKKSLIALAEKSTLLHILLWCKTEEIVVTTRTSCAELDSRLKIEFSTTYAGSPP